MADRAHRHGAHVEFVSVPDVPLAWALLSGAHWLRQPAVRAADAVVLDSIAAAPAAPWLRRVRVPIVGMLHQLAGGMDAGTLTRGVREPFDLWAYRHAAVLMVASEWLRDALVARGVAAHFLRVVPPGRDLTPGEAQRGAAALPATEAPSTARERLRGGRSIAALCVANWLPRKGIMELVEALALVPRDLVTLHMVGDTRADEGYAARVRRRLGAADLRDRVVVHGVLDPPAVAAMYESVDAFALPSFEEPYGTVWGEAMAAGLPVIGWRAGNLPYLADHGVEGLLSPVGDVSALARDLETVARDVDLRTRMAAAAALRAGTRPTWDETAELFFGVIAEVLAQRRR